MVRDSEGNFTWVDWEAGGWVTRVDSEVADSEAEASWEEGCNAAHDLFRA